MGEERAGASGCQRRQPELGAPAGVQAGRVAAAGWGMVAEQRRPRGSPPETVGDLKRGQPGRGRRFAYSAPRAALRELRRAGASSPL